MKKSAKQKTPPASLAVKTDTENLINALVERLVGLERKIDTLISRSAESSPQTRQAPAVNQQPQKSGAQAAHQPHQQQQQAQRAPENNQRERVLHKAICADCNKECQVPFKPSGDRPAYCKECFGLRKTWNPVKPKPSAPSAVSAPTPAPSVVTPAAKPAVAQKKKSAAKKVTAKKKPAAKKGKGRS